MDAPWRLLVRQGGEALVQGRFRECERLAGEAARLNPAEAAPRLLAAVARREQGRASEAEVLVRALLAEHPDVDEGHALLGAVLADLGRDGEARRQLDLLQARGAWCDAPAVGALAAETVAALDADEHAEAIEASLAGAARSAGAGGPAAWHGSTARHLGLLSHVLGRWGEAEARFRLALDADRAAGAPVLLAHTRRHYSALLRARGDDGDWERAIGLLEEAATVYRRLDIGRLADEAEAVLRRSQEPAPAGPESLTGVFRRTPSGWQLAFGGLGPGAAVAEGAGGAGGAVVAGGAGGAGLAHIAALLAADGRPVHVVDLVGAAAEDAAAAEYRARLAELDGDPAGPSGSVAAALDRAEADLLSAELSALAAGQSAPADPVERARRLVALRIRTGLDQIEGALPALAGHLRRSIRTGTFCVYEPERPARWMMGP